MVGAFAADSATDFGGRGFPAGMVIATSESAEAFAVGWRGRGGVDSERGRDAGMVMAMCALWLGGG